MTTKSTASKFTALLALGASFLMLHHSAKANAIYTISLNTAALSADSSSPFYLDFQFSSGATVGNNTVTLSNFAFTGGSATGSATTTGTASGSLGSTVTLVDGKTTLTEFYQGFTAGTTNISFTLNSTLNVDPGLNPDQFSISILDSALGSPAQIYTTAPDTASLLTGKHQQHHCARGRDLSGGRSFRWQQFRQLERSADHGDRGS
ncbi:MAG: hypothetical protein QM796_06225 [Chthoniobacteraceae bacterium]